MKNISSLDRHIGVAGSKKIFLAPTPYGKFLTNYENVLKDLNKTSKEYVDDGYNRNIDDLENVDRRYYLAIQKALDDAKTGKNYTETMRLLITCLEYDKNMVYDNNPTPEEATRIFMEMGEKQFPEVKSMTTRALQQFISSEFSNVSVAQEELMIKSLNPNNMNENMILLELKYAISAYANQCKNRILDYRKEGDIKVLYAMKLLVDNIDKKVSKVTNNQKIEELKSQL